MHAERSRVISKWNFTALRHIFSLVIETRFYDDFFFFILYSLITISREQLHMTFLLLLLLPRMLHKLFVRRSSCWFVRARKNHADWKCSFICVHKTVESVWEVHYFAVNVKWSWKVKMMSFFLDNCNFLSHRK